MLYGLCSSDQADPSVDIVCEGRADRSETGAPRARVSASIGNMRLGSCTTGADGRSRRLSVPDRTGTIHGRPAPRDAGNTRLSRSRHEDSL